jgi:hypothetical protein
MKTNSADGSAAIAFALDRLEPFEVTMFLRDWREGTDLTDGLKT